MNIASQTIHLNYAKRKQLTGKGVGVALFDTGIGYHPDLIEPYHNRLVAFYDTISGKSKYYDDNGHGTHTAGILAGSGIASNGLYRGVAPGCHFVSIKILNQRGEGSINQILEGIEWLLKHYKEYNIRLVNISVGSSRGKKFSEDSPLVTAVNSLWEAGMTVFTAAGNHGPDSYTIGAPGNSRKIITVGSSDISFPPQAKDFSGRGPTEYCIKKPDVVAPGTDIVSCYPMIPNILTGAYVPLPGMRNNLILPLSAPYSKRTGTSMSTPMICGMAALLLEKYPSMTNKEIKMRLRNRALSLGYPHSRQGWGLIQCDRLLME